MKKVYRDVDENKGEIFKTEFSYIKIKRKKTFTFSSRFMPTSFQKETVSPIHD